jgi:hypothetical protein
MCDVRKEEPRTFRLRLWEKDNMMDLLKDRCALGSADGTTDAGKANLALVLIEPAGEASL